MMVKAGCVDLIGFSGGCLVVRRAGLGMLFLPNYRIMSSECLRVGLLISMKAGYVD